MKAIVDRDTCTGCGACIDICPEVFVMGADDIAKVKVDKVPPELEARCKEAEESCPVDAISTEQ